MCLDLLCACQHTGKLGAGVAIGKIGKVEAEYEPIPWVGVIREVSLLILMRI